MVNVDFRQLGNLMKGTNPLEPYEAVDTRFLFTLQLKRVLDVLSTAENESHLNIASECLDIFEILTLNLDDLGNFRRRVVKLNAEHVRQKEAMDNGLWLKNRNFLMRKYLKEKLAILLELATIKGLLVEKETTEDFV